MRASTTMAQSTAEILHGKLKVANASIQIAERRAEAATVEADRVSTDATTQLHDMQRLLADAQAARRAAEAERDAVLRPDPVAEARVRALEHAAHEARKARDACATGHADREALDEEAEFHTACARQARHCLATGDKPGPRHAHIYLTPTASAPADRAMMALEERMEHVLSERTFIGAHRRPHGSGVAAEQRLNQFVGAVSADVKAGMDCAMAAYDTTRQVTAVTGCAARV
jgi:hypothetical protein